MKLKNLRNKSCCQTKCSGIKDFWPRVCCMRCVKSNTLLSGPSSFSGLCCLVVFYQSDYHHNPRKGWPAKLLKHYRTLFIYDLPLLFSCFTSIKLKRCELLADFKHLPTPSLTRGVFNIKSIHSHCIDRKYMRKWSDIEILFLLKELFMQNYPIVFAFSLQLSFLASVPSWSWQQCWT